METNLGQLKRTLGLFDSALLSLGATIGAGIFAATGFASQIAGPSLILSVIIAGFVATFTGVSASQLVKAFPIEGGEYEYAYLSFLSIIFRHYFRGFINFSRSNIFLCGENNHRQNRGILNEDN
jgi:amino acid transporter